ncbi:glycosyltransferase [Desulfovibrio sp. OttesenSCG-928-O18]|nr:glycosyltransferase [Desulfovibrio sp. OttesenSCG-928-O18]
MLLSIVIPVYNVAPYLEQCLESVVGQTLDDSLYEILLIDDKSTDNSLEICNAYAARHANIRVFPLPENTPGGAGFPSNFDIKNARGRYVGFVDSDDYAEPDMFAELLAVAEREKADLTFCSFTIAYPDGALARPHDAAFWETFFDPAFAALSLTEQKDKYLRLAPAPWRKLYDREFLLGNRLQFPVGDFFYEDTPFHWACVLKARHIAKARKALVTHREQREGQTVSMDRGKMALQVAGHIRTIRDFLLTGGYYTAHRKAFLDFALSMIAFVPKDNPLRPEVAQNIIAICSAPPEGDLTDFFRIAL